MSSLPILSDSSSQKKPTSSDFGGNVAIVTLGCAKNLVDSEVMLGSLVAKGFQSVSNPESADLIVVNTCAFLQSAVEEGLETILEMTKYKQSGRCKKLIVAGCMVERYRDQLKRDLPEVDSFISTDELRDIGNLTDTTEECLDEARRPYFLYDETTPRVRSTASHTTYVKIAEGCDRPCAFCIIPKIRGSFRSRPVASVASEVRMLLESGAKELNLVAQDLTAYGTDLQVEGRKRLQSLLPDLLKTFGENKQKFWTRLLYAYPIGVDEELISLVRDMPYIASYLDMPLQHISNPVLKAMRRPLGEKGTRGLIEQIRMLAPDIALRTTFVTGFPGETEEDVECLAAFIAEGHFTHVGVFPYSQEKEAVSFSFPDQVSKREKEARVRYLMQSQQRNVEQRNDSLVGKTLEVLIDGPHEESELILAARAEWQAPETDGNILITDIDEALLDADGNFDLATVVGKFASVEITESSDYDLLSRLVRVD
jgi:ribosomal protein S12 methylthiotransferase